MTNFKGLIVLDETYISDHDDNCVDTIVDMENRLNKTMKNRIDRESPIVLIISKLYPNDRV